MKIRIAGTVLCYNFTDERFEKIDSISRKQGLKIKRPGKEDLKKPVGELVGLQSVETDSKDVDFSDELLVLYGFPGTELDKFLKALRNNGLDIPYKAMVTETNKSWTAAELAKQIKEEHEQMNK